MDNERKEAGCAREIFKEKKKRKEERRSEKERRKWDGRSETLKEQEKRVLLNRLEFIGPKNETNRHTTYTHTHTHRH